VGQQPTLGNHPEAVPGIREPAQAVGRDTKGKISLAAYVVAIPVALLGWPWPAGALLIAVALIWFIPDRRIARALES